MSFYNEMQKMANDLLSNPEFKTGVITIERSLSALPDPTAAWSSPTVSKSIYTMNAVAFGVTKKYIDNITVFADDLEITASPYATFNGSQVLFEPNMDDKLSIDGKFHAIHKIERVPAAGTPVCYIICVSR